jgi:hypothetical protein
MFLLFIWLFVGLDGQLTTFFPSNVIAWVTHHSNAVCLLQFFGGISLLVVCSPQPCFGVVIQTVWTFCI